MTTFKPAFKLIASGLRFPEGPVAMPDGSVILVEIERRTLTRVSPEGKVHAIATLGGGPNGAAMGPGGKIYVTNNGGLKFVERPGRLFPVLKADDYTGGSIQIVDPETGKFKADGSSIKEAIFPLERPNGIGLSPDERTLYVVETPTARCWAFRLSAPGQIESANGPYRGEKGSVVVGTRRLSDVRFARGGR
jgi:gluconolactonase